MKFTRHTSAIFFLPPASIGSLIKMLMTPIGNRSQVTEVEVFFVVIVIGVISVVKIVANVARTVAKRKQKDKDIDNLVKNGLTL